MTTDDGLTYDDLPQPERADKVDPEELSIDGDNPNKQSDAMFDRLCRNMRKKGWLSGPIIATTDGLIADGEHRWRAAKEIGLTEVPVKFYDIDDGTRRLWRQELNKISGSHDAALDVADYERIAQEGYAADLDELLHDVDDDDLDELLDDTDQGLDGFIGDEERLGLDAEYEVIIEVDSEKEQQDVYEQLTQEGYECRLNSM